MQTHEIDLRLQRYTAAEHRIGANLQELEQHSVYQLLTTDVLTGSTAKAMGAARNADPSLWELFTLLGSTLDRARRLRGSGSRIRNEIAIELGELLNGPSVLVLATRVPIGERSMTSGSTSEDRMTIDQLIDHMTKLYEPLRDAITHSEEVLRQVLPRLESADRTMAHLRAESQSLGIDTIEIDRIAQTVERIRDLSLTDPLAIPADSRVALDEALHDVSTAIAKARSSHDELAVDIAAADVLLDECRELIATANQARSDVLRKVANPIGLRRPPAPEAIDGPRGLAARLKPIISAGGPWQTVRASLDAWASQATQLRDQLQRVVAANRRPLEIRDELRGRLQAFRAKMAATGNSEDLVLTDLSAEAHNELYTSPTDLARATRLVHEFGNRMARP